MRERKTPVELANRNTEVVEDWDTFRHFVRVIQIVGELILKDEHYEDVLKKQVQTNFLHRARASSTEAFQSLEPPNQLNLLSVFSFKDYLLEDNERIKLNTLISIIESGNKGVWVV